MSFFRFSGIKMVENVVFVEILTMVDEIMKLVAAMRLEQSRAVIQKARQLSSLSMSLPIMAGTSSFGFAQTVVHWNQLQVRFLFSRKKTLFNANER